MFNSKKESARLSLIQFTGLMTLVALIITLIAVGTSKTKQAASNSDQTVPKPSVQPPKTYKLPSPPPVLSSPTALSNSSPKNFQLVYQPNLPPNLQKSQQLQNIVDDVVALAQSKKLPTKPLSITIIDAKTGKYAGYQQHKLRYPASVVKLFWMVYFYAQVEKGILSEAKFLHTLSDSIKKSDNGAASIILDTVTNTKSGQYLAGKKYQNWLQKRLKTNKFFREAGFDQINVSHKTFPIPSLLSPKGSDLRMRLTSSKLLRNQMTTQQVARILYEIYNRQSISPVFSQKMLNILTINAQTRYLKKNETKWNGFNPVKGFLSESLPSNVYFGGKAGWTSTRRNDAAIITTPDGKAAYILVVFGEDRAYAGNLKIFPAISRFVLERMTNK